jgi:hypothetical protein
MQKRNCSFTYAVNKLFPSHWGFTKGTRKLAILAPVFKKGEVVKGEVYHDVINYGPISLPSPFEKMVNLNIVF